MFRYSLACGVICIALSAAPDADAQLVRIGPFGGVSIRVPFVSVDVSPWGDTRVRAPFTAVDAPGYRYHHYHHHHYAQRIPLYDLPNYGPYSLPYEAYSSPYRPYSAPYRSYADPGRRYDLPPDPGYALPSRPYRSDAPYRSDVPYRSDSPYGSDLPADPGGPIELPYSPYDADWFRSMERASSTGGGAADEPKAALRQSTIDAASRLSRALQRRSDGQVWQDYLQPDTIVQIVSDAASVDADRLRDLLQNFDGVTANDSLRWVTRLDGFDETRRLLRQWASADSEPPSPAVDRSDEAEPPESEELPLPPGEAETIETKQRFEA